MKYGAMIYGFCDFVYIKMAWKENRMRKIFRIGWVILLIISIISAVVVCFLQLGFEWWGYWTALVGTTMLFFAVERYIMWYEKGIESGKTKEEMNHEASKNHTLTTRIAFILNTVIVIVSIIVIILIG